MPTDFCPASPKISNIVRHVMYPITICCKDCPALTCFCSVLPVLFSYRSCLSSGTEGSLWGWWVMMGEETQGGKWRQISVQYWDVNNYMHPRASALFCLCYFHIDPVYLLGQKGLCGVDHGWWWERKHREENEGKSQFSIEI